jgi:molecular chaperone DnaK
MVKDAEAHAAEDKQKRELVEARNQGEALVHATEKELTENGSNPAVAAIKDDVEKAIASAKEAIASDDAERIKQATQTLAQVAMKIGEAVYAAKASSDGGSDEAPAAKDDADDNVVDADFEEVKDDKKKAG